MAKNVYEGGYAGDRVGSSPLGRWPANFIHDGSDEVLALLGEAARFYYSAKASRDDRNEGCGALEEKPAGSLNMRTDSHAIKNRQETNPRSNPHPTVKPTDLMRYLCRLITPPNGIVLDPFMGSGSTGKAAMAEGFRFIGIEREAEYIEIARARISAEADKPRRLSLF
jgi:site-specific DNA-methyltransferase (adenine-specific)